MTFDHSLMCPGVNETSTRKHDAYGLAHGSLGIRARPRQQGETSLT